MTILISVGIWIMGFVIGWGLGLCTDAVITSFKSYKTDKLLKEMRNDKSDGI